MHSIITARSLSSSAWAQEPHSTVSDIMTLKIIYSLCNKKNNSSSLVPEMRDPQTKESLGFYTLRFWVLVSLESSSLAVSLLVTWHWLHSLTLWSHNCVSHLPSSSNKVVCHTDLGVLSLKSILFSLVISCFLYTFPMTPIMLELRLQTFYGGWAMLISIRLFVCREGSGKKKKKMGTHYIYQRRKENISFPKGIVNKNQMSDK